MTAPAAATRPVGGAATDAVTSISGTFHLLEWARIAADMVFLVIGVVPIVIATLQITLLPASPELRPALAPGGGARAVA